MLAFPKKRPLCRASTCDRCTRCIIQQRRRYVPEERSPRTVCVIVGTQSPLEHNEDCRQLPTISISHFLTQRMHRARASTARIREPIPGLDMIIRFSRGNVIALAGSLVHPLSLTLSFSLSPPLLFLFLSFLLCFYFFRSLSFSLLVCRVLNL